MSFPQPPNFNYNTTIYPWGQPFQAQDNNWTLWNSDDLNPLTLSFDTGLGVTSIWIPALTGPVTCYAGDTATGTPFYITQGAGSELIPVPTSTIDVTMVGSGGEMYVYWTTLVLDPFRQGVIGNQVTAVTATLPILSSGGTQPDISLQTPLAIIYGGTGSAAPVGVQAAPSSGIIVTGSFPDQTLSLDFTGLGVVTAVTASSPLSSTGGSTPNISIASAIPVALGGTGQTAPALNAGHGIVVSGTIFQPTGGSAWTVTNDGVTSLTGDSGPTITGDITLHGKGGIVTSGSGATISIDGSGVGFAVYQGSSTPVAGAFCCVGNSSVSLSGSSGPNSGTSGSTTVTLPVAFSGASSYSVVLSPQTNWVMWDVSNKSGGSFRMDLGNPFPPGNQTINVDWIAIG